MLGLRKIMSKDQEKVLNSGGHKEMRDTLETKWIALC